MDAKDVEGWEHALAAAEALKGIVDSLFRLPEAAQRRAVAARAARGDDHGDDLTCGCWQAALAATALLELAGRHADALVHLADAHPAFAPSAQVLARASLECALRVAWLLAPQDARDREQRWVAMEREETRFFKNVSAVDESDYEARIAELEALASAIGGAAVASPPSVEAMAAEYGRTSQLYSLYRFNSQAVHGTLVGAGTFDPDARQEWMALGKEGEWVEAEFWGIPLAAAWEGLAAATRRYRDLLAPEEALDGLAGEERFRMALSQLPPNYQVRRALLERPAEPAAPLAPNRAQRRATDRRQRRRRG